MGVDVLERPKVDEYVDHRTETTDETEDGKAAHIVRVKPPKSAVAIVTEALVFGTPVEFLCGKVKVPDRDPKKLPLCSKCKEIYELARAEREDLNEIPTA